MQASFVMVANKKALKYSPRAPRSASTHDQLAAWSRNIQNRRRRPGSGSRGEKGLMHRFLQGYLYPSFTGSTSCGFGAKTHASRGRILADLWESVDPGSPAYSSMDEPPLGRRVDRLGPYRSAH